MTSLHGCKVAIGGKWRTPWTLARGERREGRGRQKMSSRICSERNYNDVNLQAILVFGIPRAVAKNNLTFSSKPNSSRKKEARWRVDVVNSLLQTILRDCYGAPTRMRRPTFQNLLIRSVRIFLKAHHLICVEEAAQLQDTKKDEKDDWDLKNKMCSSIYGNLETALIAFKDYATSTPSWFTSTTATYIHGRD
jgi:hypothetical protein